MTIPTKKEIIEFSPMNSGGNEELPEYKRHEFSELQRVLKNGLIVAITGLRRVGKTTISKQVAPSGHYFSFDEKQYANPDALKEVIETFLREDDYPLIILDEVFRVDDWAGIIKRYYDQKKARFIVSGSSSLTIKKSIESLSGRICEIYLPPLNFQEFLELKGNEVKSIRVWKKYLKPQKDMMENLKNFLKKDHLRNRSG